MDYDAREVMKPEQLLLAFARLPNLSSASFHPDLDLLKPNVDCFMPLPSGPLVPISTKTGSFVFKILWSQV